MRRVDRALRTRGYETLNCGYPSRGRDIAMLAAGVAQRVTEWASDGTLDFVTHSLGGILVRVAVASGALPRDRVGRVVMLGTPNEGSELADLLPAMPMLGSLYARLTGPAGLELGTTESGVPGRLPPVDFEVGVIAGDRSWNPWFSALLGEPNDGKVRVERTRVEGMTDFLVVPHWHPMLVSATDVIKQVVHFLEHGVFDK
jgi:triacylglycerol lipase